MLIEAPALRKLRRPRRQKLPMLITELGLLLFSQQSSPITVRRPTEIVPILLICVPIPSCVPSPHKAFSKTAITQNWLVARHERRRNLKKLLTELPKNTLFKLHLPPTAHHFFPKRRSALEAADQRQRGVLRRLEQRLRCGPEPRVRRERSETKPQNPPALV